MIPLRFRAWHPSEKKMHKDVIVGNNLLIYSMNPESDERVWDYADDTPAIVMQSSGLFSLNDDLCPEIFEGDICDIGNDIQNIPCLAVVQYLDDGFCLVEEDNTIHSLADAVFRPGFDVPSGKPLRSALVVGNIYQNADLVPNWRP